MKYENFGGTPPVMALDSACYQAARRSRLRCFRRAAAIVRRPAIATPRTTCLIKTYPKEAGFVCLQSARPDVFDAVSAEEGGDLILDRGKDRDTLMVYLDDSLIMVKRANRGN